MEAEFFGVKCRLVLCSSDFLILLLLLQVSPLFSAAVRFIFIKASRVGFCRMLPNEQQLTPCVWMKNLDSKGIRNKSLERRCAAEIHHQPHM